MKQMTAVEWFANNVPKIDFEDDPYYRELLNKAKRLENQQLIEMFDKGFDSVEQLNDEYAIEFAEWCIESEGKAYNNYKYRNRKELLEIFKKEKGL